MLRTKVKALCSLQYLVFLYKDLPYFRQRERFSIFLGNCILYDMELNDLPEPGEGNIYERVPKKTRQLAIEAAELVSCDPDEGSVRCDTYIFDPDESEAKLGSLYLVLETINSSEKSVEVLDAVSTAIRKEYYRDPERSMFDSLEEALNQANHVLSDYVEQGEVDFVDNFHAAACAFCGQNLHISRVGNAEILLARKGRLTDIGEGLSDNNLRRPHHAFTSVASGSVSESDLLMLTTPQLSHLIPHDRLNQMVSSKNPSEVITLLRSLLDDSRENTAFALLLMQFSRMPERLPAPEVPLNLPRRVNPNPIENPPLRQSVRPRRPINTKRTIWTNLARITGQIAHFSWKFCKEKLYPALKVAFAWSASKGTRAFSATTSKAGSSYKAWKERRLNQEEQQAEDDPVVREYSGEEEFSFEGENEVVQRDNFIKRLPSMGKNLVHHIPVIKKPNLQISSKKTAALSALVILLATIFFFSIRSLSKKNEENTQLRLVAEKLEQAKVKKDNAESALIYNNVDKARSEMIEARTIIGEVEKSKHYQNETVALLASLQSMEDRIEKITRISNPVEVGDFASVASSLKTPAMAAIGKDIFTFDPTTNAIYKLNTENKTTSIASQSSQGIGYFRAAVPVTADKMILFSTDTPGLALYDTQRGDLLKQEIKLPEGVTNIKSLGVFGSRLYLLSPEKNMIYGYSKTLAGYEGGSEWLKDKNVSANKAVGMGIDGYIYLLMNDGKIVKMLKGNPVEFKQAALTKPVQNPTRLLIYDGLKHLYVLDSEQKRVIVYDTTGNITNQFVFPNAKSLKDIAIGGKEEILYILDETKVYSTTLK